MKKCILFLLLITLCITFDSNKIYAKSNSFKLNKASISIYKGKTYKLKASNIKGKVKWSTKNKKIATVNSNGKVTAKKAGTTYVYAKNKGKTQKCKVIIKNKTFTINKTSITLYNGKTYTIKANNAKGKVKWTTKNKKIATVNSNGKVTPKKAGTTYIYAKNKTKTKKCKVVVKTLKINKSSVTIYTDETYTLKASNYSSKVTWSSKNNAIATVNSNGKVTAKKVGTTYITAKSGNITKKCKIIIKKLPYILDEDNITLEVGKSKKLTGNFYDIKDKTLTYKSDNPNIVTVDSNGIVTAISKGNATITITTSNNKTQTCKIKSIYVLRSSDTHYISHRGLHTTYKENTMDAFKEATNNGYYGIETDVQISKDGEFVLSHDENLSRVFGIDKNISELTLNELKELTNNEIPTLKEFLEYMSSRQEIPFIELKNITNEEYPDLELQTAKVLDLIGSYNMLDKSYITSFKKELIEEVRKQDSSIKIQFITNGTYDIEYLKTNKFGLDLNFSSSTKECVQELRNNNINVCLWVLDSEKKTIQALSYEPNSITTNKHLFINIEK